MSNRIVRRVVTGHDEAGRAVFIADGPTPHGVTLEAARAEFFEIWSTRESPATIAAQEHDPTDRPLAIPPARCGSVIRIVDIHPGLRAAGTIDAAAIFGQVGSADASTWTPDARHPLMHRTETVDYGIVLEGQVYLILDEGETCLSAGDVVVQRGTNHAWENRAGQTCRIAFILLDGAFDPALKSKMPAY